MTDLCFIPLICYILDDGMSKLKNTIYVSFGIRID